jgi:trigger factor
VAELVDAPDLGSGDFGRGGSSPFARTKPAGRPNCNRSSGAALHKNPDPDMQITETAAEGLKREFTVVVAASDIQSRVDARLSELGREVRLPGFRPGKVPMPILKKRYGQSVLGEVLEQTVNDGASQAIQEKGLKPALQPKIEVTKFEEGADLEYKVAVEVLPEIAPPEFASIALERLVTPVDDTAIDEALGRLAQSRKGSEPVTEDRASETGDVVVIDFQGTVDGVAHPGMDATAHQLELGSGSFVGTFEAQLVGAKAGEHRTVTVSFPADYGAEDLRGKEAVFEVDVKELRRSVLPAIDDQFAKDVGFDDVAGLREAVKERIDRDYRQASRARLKRALLDVLAGKADFEAPVGMVDMEFDAIWRRLKDEMERGGAPEEAGKDEDALKAEYRTIAERRVKLGLMLAEVGKRNSIEVSRDELSRAVVAEAQRFPGQERQVYDFFQKNPQAVEQLRAPLFEDKVVDFIVELANVSERAVSLEELLKDPGEEA